MEHFRTIKPEDHRLRTYISYYYFHELDAEQDRTHFKFYPHFKHGYTFYLKQDGILEKALYTMNYQEQASVIMQGIIYKVGVAFHPLGINHFLENNLDTYYAKSTRAFPVWNEQVVSKLGNIFERNDLNQRCRQLDHFFLNMLRVKPELILIKNALNLIFDSFGTIKIADLADQLGLSRRTLQREFHKHLCCSPEMYKKVVKFRVSIMAAQQKNLKNLTEVSLYSLYYDQADFTKRFKELTQQTPKDFFAGIRQMGGEDIFWSMMD